MDEKIKKLLEEITIFRGTDLSKLKQEEVKQIIDNFEGNVSELYRSGANPIDNPELSGLEKELEEIKEGLPYNNLSNEIDSLDDIGNEQPEIETHLDNEEETNIEDDGFFFTAEDSKAKENIEEEKITEVLPEETLEQPQIQEEITEPEKVIDETDTTTFEENIEEQNFFESSPEEELSVVQEEQSLDNNEVEEKEPENVSEYDEITTSVVETETIPEIEKVEIKPTVVIPQKADQVYQEVAIEIVSTREKNNKVGTTKNIIGRGNEAARLVVGKIQKESGIDEAKSAQVVNQYTVNKVDRENERVR